MGTKLDLSALKNKAQHVKTDKVNSTISGREGDLGQASRSISLGATVKKTPVVHETTPNIPAKKIETQSVKCDCPVSNTHSPHNTTIPSPTATPTAPQTQTIATPQKGSQEYLTAIQKNEAEKPQTNNAVVETESEGKKTMISLSSIKSSHSEKKPLEENIEQKEDGITSDQKEKIEKEITVVAPAMKIASVNVETTIKDKKNNSGKDLQSSTLKGKAELTPVDTKLIEKESKKLKNQIEKDLNDNDEKEKNKVEIDDNIFENYKPKYGKKEKVEKDGTPKFKRHLSSKKRNALIAGLILFVLGVSAGGYMFFNNSGSGTDGIQAIAVENNIVQTKENVENIINNETENEEDLEETIIDNEDSNSETEEEGGEDTEAEIEDISNELTEEETVEKNVEEIENGEIAQAETSGESKVKNYLLDNYYK